MLTNEWIGFAAEMVVLIGGLTAISIWMGKRFDDMKAWMEMRFELVDERFKSVDERFKSMDERFKSIDERFKSMDTRFDSTDKRFDDMQRSMDRRFGEVRAELGLVRTEIGLVRTESRDAHAEIGQNIRDVEQRIGARFDDLKDILAN